MNDISNELVAKIAKLLRVATSDNQHEAELAMSHAKRLCVQHDIDLASINAFEPKASEEPVIKSEAVNMGKRLPISEKYVCHIIQDFFKTRIIYHGGRYHGRTVTFIGKKNDIEISNHIYNYLNSTFLRLWREYYYQNEKDIRLEERGSFFSGLRDGLVNKLNQLKQETETENFETIKQEKGAEIVDKIKNQYAMVLVSEQKRVQDKVKEYYPKLGTISRSYKYVHSRNAFEDGVSQGKNINLNRGYVE